ncbi:MAG: MopE-related protein [Myxococcota bacterium]
MRSTSSALVFDAYSSSPTTLTLKRLIIMPLQLLSWGLLLALLLNTGCGYDPTVDTPTPTQPPPTPTVEPSTPTPIIDPTPTQCPDSDDDGVCDGSDCDAQNASVYPGAKEICDGKDNDCDEEVPTEELDQDQDGYAPCQKDCNDDEASFYPKAPEQCDGKDNDCDGKVPSEETDQDADGVVSCVELAEGCESAATYDNASYPGAEELCDAKDNNCNGSIDEPFDLDLDGYFDGSGCDAAHDSLDCDDHDADIHPDQAERCDGGLQDENCNDLVDDQDVDLENPDVWYHDADGDGYATTAKTTEACEQPAGYLANATPIDCNDTAFAINPGATELCNNLDDNCSGTSDEGFDEDKDGFTQCGTGGKDKDCDDTNAAAYPGASELCNGEDEDCNGAAEADSDGDTYFDCQEGFSGCKDDPARNPKVAEICDKLDNDCDGQTDEGFPDGVEDSDADGMINCQDTCPRWVDISSTATPEDGLWSTPFRSIQAAIDAQDTNACRLLIVRKGTYAENLNLRGKPLQLAGWYKNLVDQTVVDGRGLGPVVTLNSGETSATELKNLTFTNGNASAGTTGTLPLKLEQCGGGIRIVNASPTLSGLLVEGNVAASGAGICIQGGAPTIGSLMTIADNVAEIAGGGMLLDGGTSAVIEGKGESDISVTGNLANLGAGIYCGSFSPGTVQARMRWITMRKNLTTTGGLGGGLYVSPLCKGGIDTNYFYENEADKGGGAYVSSTSNALSLSNNSFFDNESSYGGGLFVTGSSGLLLSGGIISRCSALLGAGAYVDSSAALSATGTVFTYNNAAQSGGGLYAGTSSALTMSNGTFDNNTASENGGGLYADRATLSINGTSTTQYLQVVNNKANGSGGGFYFKDVTSNQISFASFDANYAKNGGGVAAVNTSLTFRSNRFVDNKLYGTEGVDGAYCEGPSLMKVPISNSFSSSDQKNCPSN